MRRLKLKGIKMVQPGQSTKNASGCEVVGGTTSDPVPDVTPQSSNPAIHVGSTRSAPLPNVTPRSSTPSSSDDSNLNDEAATNNTCTRLDNLHPINEGSNLNSVDNRGQQRKRGRTTIKELWTLPPQERILVSSNQLGQPIGPEAQLLAAFLGMLARSGQHIGLQYENWHKVPKPLKDDLFKFIELRFSLEISKEYVLKSLGKKWRDYKHDLKTKHFKREDGLQANKDKHPSATIQWQWEQLVDFWYSKKGEDSEKLGVASRKQQKYTHTCGSKSFARKQKEMEVSTGRNIGRLELFKATHTKKDGSHMNAETEQIMESANEKLIGCDTTDEDMQMVEAEILTQVIGKERCGRVRGVGLGPTPKSYYGGSSSQKSTNSNTQSSELVERLHQMEQEVQKMKDERMQERAQVEQQNTQYNELLSFLQSQFPGVTIPGVNNIGSSSQSQDNPSADQ
ncbi:putative transposase Ptta/En/Spm plant protein [Dioscorea alata]|uniref:Transposase Ptta/En/Spm plant protein n=1 Tax=Dioscorea alata TaxID=55571 RepID=A0ACB7U678_DIOAL|nr:putative transposase Ptta/En/Spm plant protein [Dioscorea alata]